MQYLGEISAAQRPRGKDKQDKRQAKPRKGFSNRRFERRFWVLLPPGAKVPRAGARNVLFDNPSVPAFGRDTSATLRYAQPSMRTGLPLHKEGFDTAARCVSPSVALRATPPSQREAGTGERIATTSLRTGLAMTV